MTARGNTRSPDPDAREEDSTHCAPIGLTDAVDRGNGDRRRAGRGRVERSRAALASPRLRKSGALFPETRMIPSTLLFDELGIGPLLPKRDADTDAALLFRREFRMRVDVFTWAYTFAP